MTRTRKVYENEEKSLVPKSKHKILIKNKSLYLFYKLLYRKKTFYLKFIQLFQLVGQVIVTELDINCRKV